MTRRLFGEDASEPAPGSLRAAVADNVLPQPFAIDCLRARAPDNYDFAATLYSTLWPVGFQRLGEGTLVTYWGPEEALLGPHKRLF